jgi:exonuclease III
MWGKKKVATEPAAEAETTVPAPESVSSAIAKKCRLTKVDFDFKGTQHSGEGRTIVLDLDCMTLIGCYVPNSGQNLDRLPYRINDW